MKSKAMLTDYFKAITEVASQGNARSGTITLQEEIDALYPEAETQIVEI